MELGSDGTGRSQRLRTGFFVEFHFLLARLAIGLGGRGLLRHARLVDVSAGAGAAHSVDLTGVQTSLLLLVIWMRFEDSSKNTNRNYLRNRLCQTFGYLNQSMILSPVPPVQFFAAELTHHAPHDVPSELVSPMRIEQYPPALFWPIPTEQLVVPAFDHQRIAEKAEVVYAFWQSVDIELLVPFQVFCQFTTQAFLKYAVSMAASVEEFLDWSFHATVGAIEEMRADPRRQLAFVEPKLADHMSAAIVAALPEYGAAGTCTPTSVQPPPSLVMSQYASNAARGPVPSISIG